jgi:hypothetical protein
MTATWTPTEAATDESWNPPEASWTPDEVNPDAQLQKMGVDTAPPEASFIPSEHPIAENLISGLGETVKELFPTGALKTVTPAVGGIEGIREGYRAITGEQPQAPDVSGVGQLSEFLTPIASIPKEIGQDYGLAKDVISGKPINEAVATNVPESQTLAEAQKTPDFSKERFKAGFGVLANMLMAAGVGHGLAEKLAPVTGKRPTVEPSIVPEAKIEPPAETEKAADVTQPAEETQPQANVEAVAATPEPVLESEKAANEGAPVSSETQTPSDTGVSSTELPENTEVTLKATTPKGEPLEVKMDAKEAGKVLTDRKTALENLIDCLGA